MIKLVDAVNTKYLTTNWCSAVIDCLNTGEPIDVAGAHICRDVMGKLLTAAYQGQTIIDSEDAERSALFEENKRRGELARTSPNLTLLPLPHTAEEVVQSIQELDATKEYEVRNSQDKAEVAYAILVQMARPEIKLHLQSAVSEVFRAISAALFPNPHRWDEFYLLTGNTFVTTTVGEADYTEFVSGNIVVPTEFGRKCLVHCPEWQSCLSRTLSTFQQELHPVGRHIRDYL